MLQQIFLDEQKTLSDLVLSGSTAPFIQQTSSFSCFLLQHLQSLIEVVHGLCEESLLLGADVCHQGLGGGVHLFQVHPQRIQLLAQRLPGKYNMRDISLAS